MIDVGFFSRSRMTILWCALLPAARPATDRAEVVRVPLRLHSRGLVARSWCFRHFSRNRYSIPWRGRQVPPKLLFRVFLQKQGVKVGRVLRNSPTLFLASEAG